jgi:hypothetical protein
MVKEVSQSAIRLFPAPTFKLLPVRLVAPLLSTRLPSAAARARWNKILWLWGLRALQQASTLSQLVHKVVRLPLVVLLLGRYPAPPE